MRKVSSTMSPSSVRAVALAEKIRICAVAANLYKLECVAGSYTGVYGAKGGSCFYSSIDSALKAIRKLNPYCAVEVNYENSMPDV